MRFAGRGNNHTAVEEASSQHTFHSLIVKDRDECECVPRGCECVCESVITCE